MRILIIHQQIGVLLISEVGHNGISAIIHPAHFRSCDWMPANSRYGFTECTANDADGHG